MIDAALVERAIVEIRKSTANYAYFFDKLSSPEWVEPLHARGFFRAPPPPIRAGDSVSFPSWPESRYLARMASIESAAPVVASIAERIPPTENVRVHHDLADIALALPPPLGARFVPATRSWIRSPYQLLLPEQLGSLIERLAAGGQLEPALELARALLEIVPDVRDETPAADNVGRRDVRAHFDAWHYREILRKILPALVQAGSQRTLGLMCDLLDSALELSSPGRRTGEWEDYSWVWRPAIEDHEQNSGRSVEDALVTGVRDSAEQIVRCGDQTLSALLEELESRKWTVFRRIALHVAATFADPVVAEVRLTNRGLFDDASVRHEYFRLAKSAFSAIPGPAQATMLSHIEQGPDMDAAARWLRDALGREPSSADLVRYLRTWQLKYLSALKNTLPLPWAERYREWVNEYGEPEHPDFVSYHWSGWVGASSPKNADELRALTPEELIGFLSSWQATGKWGEPSREGLANELQAVIASDPAPYAAAANHFKRARAIFVRALVSGLRDAAKQGKRFEWTHVLELFAWVVQQEIAAHSGEYVHGEEDPALGWTRKAIADFMSDALEHEDRWPPEALRRVVWSVLRPLAEDPDPTPEDEERYGPPNMDPFTMSLNTTRGQALHAIVNYIHWVSRHSPTDTVNRRTWISRCPEACEVLEDHLRLGRDPSRAVRSVYGQRLPTLAYLDLEWVHAHLRSIFPADAEYRALREAAWDAFVVFCNPQTALLNLLRDEYEHAVGALASRSVSKRGRDPVERLAEHLMTLYWWGDLDLAADGIVSRFFSLAGDDVREHAMDFVGRSLSGPEAPPPEVVRRLRSLWEIRLEAAKTEPSHHVEELSGFGWWFTSGRFDDDWALIQLRAVLALTRKIEPADKVIERLADLANDRPLASLLAFEETVDADKEGWLVSVAQEGSERLLKAALSHNESRERAVDVLHRLGAKGHSEFRRLLRA